MSRSVHIEHVTKRYGSFTAVDGVSLDIKEGEFFTLLGPSGCGKTTLLRMIIGFNSVDGGEIRFNDERINDVPPHRRNIGMVFQNYAVFPHLTVFENVAYGLKARKVGRAEIATRVAEVLKLIRIEAYAKRQISQLSGGQQQRVALARAIVIEPSILLMDEPLSNLDAKLRLEMRAAIRDIQRKLGITTVYVTHDQEEALAISDRIAVMDAGHIRQMGSPEDIYARPANRFVAGFIGIMNFLEVASEAAGNGTARLRLPGGGSLDLPLRKPVTGPVLLAARPEDIRLLAPGKGSIEGSILDSTFLGETMHYLVGIPGGQRLEVTEYAPERTSARRTGDQVSLGFAESRLSVFSADGEEALI